MNDEASIIDFNATFLDWTIHGEISGRANAECTITHLDLASEEKEEFIFSQGVLACHVLKGKKMMMEPTYLFQTSMSEKKFKSFRTGTSLSTQNDHGLTASRYDSVKTHIARAKGKKAGNPEAIQIAMNEHKRISASIEIRSGQDVYIIEFPGKFVYYHAREKQFQIEAGPVLLPQEFDRMDLPASWDPCYITFNTFNRFEYARSTTSGLRQYQEFGPIQELVAKISVYASL